MQYWVGRNGQKLGPYTIEDLRGMAAHGGAVASDLVWAEGMANWAPLFTVIGPPSAAPPAATAAPPPMPQYQPASPVMPMPAAATSRGPMPPDLHWGLVLVISFFVGVFLTVWLFLQANFVKKIDATNKSMPMLIAHIIGLLAAPVVFVIVLITGGAAGLLTVRSQDLGGLAGGIAGVGIGLGFLLMMGAFVVSLVCLYIGVFRMRTSLVNYYNTVEPIGLRLSPVMTFFFHVLYFQYHFNRITKWKQTGVLDPQG